MATKMLVSLRTPRDADKLRRIGCKVLAEYPDTVLVRCTRAEREALSRSSLEASDLTEPEVRVSGNSFAFASAVAAEKSKPIKVDGNRRAYYVVKLVGPPAGDWLKFIRDLGGSVESNLKGFSLLVGMLPGVLATLKKQVWVEAVVPYRPAMKISRKLRSDPAPELTVDHLATARVRRPRSAKPVRVEISVFSGESTAEIGGEVRKSGGAVLSETERSIIATLLPRLIPGLAGRQAVQSIRPHVFPEFSNDQATDVIQVPADRVFGDVELAGAEQVVAVCDSGLDTGNVVGIHADFAGRITGLVSWGMHPAFGPYTNDPVGNDDGAADTNSGHGTHVAGSVLADGDAATGVGGTPVPRGTAPEANLYFQAIEQAVNWRTAAQLAADGLPPFADPWPPDAVGLFGLPFDLNDLFQPAYDAGARIHTNSWGAPMFGEYTDSSHQVDDFMWNHRDMLILYAAGNQGADADANAMVDEDSIDAPATAKNCLTVGACENDRPSGSAPAPGLDADWDVIGPGGVPRWPQLGAAGHVSDDPDGMAAFSSRGPTDDGRIKPEVVAPGTNVLSTRSSTYAGAADPLWGDLPPAHALSALYCWSGGTSMSTPLVAGAAALVRQHLVQQRGHHVDGEKPSGALIKAFLVNGAETLGGGQYSVNIGGVMTDEVPDEPNNVDGFGRVNLLDSITPGVLLRTLFADEPDFAVETGEIRAFEAQVIDIGQPLRVTLVWTDAPAPGGVGGIENELYLQVERPDGVVVDGDVTAFPVVSNNVQRVVIDAPIAGTYEIRVRGVSITQHAPGAAAGANPRQDFALAVSNGMGFSMQPVSIAQAIDTTGSMGYYGYLEPAKERAKQLVDFLRINDKVSITEFSQRSGVPADARTPYPLRLLGSFDPDWTDARTEIDALVSDGRTPIGAGLQAAYDQISGEPAGRPRAIILLSDGHNNEPPTPATVLPGIPVDVPIFTIALGPASDIPELQAIAASRPGGGYYAVQSDEDIHQLHEIYANIQSLAAGAPLVGLSSTNVGSQKSDNEEVPVDPGAEEAVFTLSWERRPDIKAMVLVAKDPGGVEHTALVPGTMEAKGASYHFIRVAAPRAGKWTLTARNLGSRRKVPCTFSAVVRSGFTLSAQAIWSEGREVLVVARLRRGAKLYDGKAKIVAHVMAPTRSRSSVLRRHMSAIAKVKLSPRILEKGLSQEQILNLRISEFARKYKGDLFRRKKARVLLRQAGDGSFRGKVPLKASGTVSVEFQAQGTVRKAKWRRSATCTVHVPERVSVPSKLRIGDVKAKRDRKRRRVVISVQILKSDATPASPLDLVSVDMALILGKRRMKIEDAPYRKRARCYQWQIPEKQIGKGEIQLNIAAKVLSTVVAKAQKTLTI